MKIIASIVILISIVAIFFSLKKEDINLKGSVYSRVATSSTISVGVQEVKTLFSNRNACSSRVISTVAQPIMLSFHTDITPTALIGHLQAASTTVAYPSDDFGCGIVKAYGHNASTTITISEAVF